MHEIESQKVGSIPSKKYFVKIRLTVVFTVFTFPFDGKKKFRQMATIKFPLCMYPPFFYLKSTLMRLPR